MSYGHLDLTLDPVEEVRCRYKFRKVIKKVGNKTHFSHDECEVLLLIHYKLTKEQTINRKYFRRIMFTMFDFQNDFLMDRIFSAFDRSNKLEITKRSWLLGMSMFLRGTLDEKIKFCFKVYDMMGDGYIKREQMFQALKNNYRGSQYDEDPEEIIRDLIDVIMKKMDRDRDGILSYQDYSESVRQNPNLLEALGYCLPSRPAVYAFMETFTTHVTTMHAKLFSTKPFHI